MKENNVQDPNYEKRVRSSFARQKVMQTIGATMTRVDPGIVEIVLPYNAELTQQNGFIHAGIVSTIMDSACGYAAYTLMPADAAVLTVEFKVNLLSPAQGELIKVRSEVKRAGQNITVCSADAWAVDMGQGKLVATMLATVMCVRGRSDLIG
jgi:uncharacterized protein (TIGR00369 family)